MGELPKHDKLNRLERIMAIDDNKDYTLTGAQVKDLAAKVKSGGTPYTAGNGIDIDANNEISIDDTVVAELSDLPTKTSDLQNDGSDGTSTYVEADELATVATSGSYNDLSNKPTIPAAQVQSNWTQTNTSAADYIKNKPTIPTVNNATLTIQKNGTTVKTFTANASSNVTANITTDVSSTSTQLDVGSWHLWFFSFSNSASGWTTKDLTHPTAFRGKVKHVSCFGLWGNSGDNRLGAWVEYNNNTVLRLRVYQAAAGSNAFMGVAYAYY